MRVIIFLIVLQIIVSLDAGFCKDSTKIEIGNLLIVKTSQSPFIKLGFSKNEVIKSFGKPMSIKKTYFTKFDFEGEVIKYSGGEFYFVDDKLEAFELTNNRFTLKIADKDLYAVVGNKLSTFKGLNGIVLQKNGVNLDEVLGFILNSDNRIIHIICGPD